MTDPQICKENTVLSMWKRHYNSQAVWRASKGLIPIRTERSMTERLTFCFTCLDSAVLLLFKKNRFTCLDGSKPEHLQSCGPGFKSLSHYLRFLNLGILMKLKLLLLLEWENDGNKWKRGWDGPIFKKNLPSTFVLSSRLTSCVFKFDATAYSFFCSCSCRPSDESRTHRQKIYDATKTKKKKTKLIHGIILDAHQCDQIGRFLD